jgi:hypothetical protein
MAKIKVEDIIDHLDSEMRGALEAAVNEVIPGAAFDSRDLFRAFKRHIYNKCSIWESVPDRFVEP